MYFDAQGARTLSFLLEAKRVVTTWDMNSREGKWDGSGVVVVVMKRRKERKKKKRKRWEDGWVRRSSREDRKDEKKHVRQSARCREKETMLDFGFYSFHFWPHEPVFIVKRKTTIVHCNPKVGRRVTDIILIEKATHRLYLWYVYVHKALWAALY